MYLKVGVCMCVQCPWSPEEGIRAFVAAALGVCELPDLGLATDRGPSARAEQDLRCGPFAPGPLLES